ncbi:MAG TPA: hypothetical protein VH796_02615 [Nitrososphaeraceae archaeon]|jgi:hypothetical protein
MTQQEEDNSVLLNEYLEENSRRSQLADKAVQAKAEAINIEKAAESVDPLQDLEPNTNSGNSDMKYELDIDTTTNTERPPAEESDESLLAKIKVISHETRTRSYNKSISPLSKKKQQQQLTSDTGTMAVVNSKTRTKTKGKAAKKKASKSKQQ